eukprot:scaffold35262_cov73-Isochrysis_galbana.AAC.1
MEGRPGTRDGFGGESGGSPPAVECWLDTMNEYVYACRLSQVRARSKGPGIARVPRYRPRAPRQERILK